MDHELPKASSFVARLLANRALDILTPLQKEEQILQFLTSNAQQLFPTLSSPGFFPGKSWTAILDILKKALMLETNKQFIPQLQELIQRLDYTFISFLQNKQVAAEQCREDHLDLLNRLLEKVDARSAVTDPFMAVFFNLPDRYVDVSLELRQYVYLEITKVERLQMSKEEIKNMIKSSLLLKATNHLLTTGITKGPQELLSGLIHPKFADKVFNTFKDQIKALPPALLRSAINSNVSFQENKDIEATARVAAIFAARAKTHKPKMKIDRGANTADRSWFNIARRNYKHYGFDIKMLDEFYRIAAENGW